MKVIAGKSAKEDHLEDMLYSKIELHTCIISPQDLITWITDPSTKTKDEALWANELITKGWPKDSLMQDIPTGTAPMRYELSFDIFKPLRSNRPIDIINKIQTQNIITNQLKRLKNKPAPPCTPRNEFGEAIFDAHHYWKGAEVRLIYAKDIEAIIENTMYQGIGDNLPPQTVINSEKGEPTSETLWMFYIHTWNNIDIKSIRNGLTI